MEDVVVAQYATMPPTSNSAAATTAHSFTKILNQYKSSSKTRSTTDVEESVKKLRRLILVDGIPSSVVRFWFPQFLVHTELTLPCDRIRPYDHGYGRYFCESTTYLRVCSWSTSPEALVKFERRSGTTHSGMHRLSQIVLPLTYP